MAEISKNIDIELVWKEEKTKVKNVLSYQGGTLGFISRQVVEEIPHTILLKAVNVISMNQSTETTDNPIENAKSVTNQRFFSTKIFRITGMFYDAYDGNDISSNRNDQYEELQSIYDEGLVFSLNASFGYYENVIISNLEIVNKNTTESSYDVSMTLKEIRIVTPEKINYQLIVDSEGNITGATPSDTGGLREVDLDDVSADSRKGLTYKEIIIKVIQEQIRGIVPKSPFNW